MTGDKKNLIDLSQITDNVISQRLVKHIKYLKKPSIVKIDYNASNTVESIGVKSMSPTKQVI